MLKAESGCHKTYGVMQICHRLNLRVYLLKVTIQESFIIGTQQGMI